MIFYTSGPRGKPRVGTSSETGGDPCLWIDGVKGLRGPFLEFPKADIRHVSANLVVGVFQHGTPALCVQDLPRFQDSR